VSEPYPKRNSLVNGVPTIRKAVLPVAGFDTRLLPMTKEMPKGMLPIFLDSGSGGPCLKPMIQAVYEQLYYTGF